MGPILEEEELAAIRAAMGQATPLAPSSSSVFSNTAPTSVALIAEDRAASQARPNALRLAARWARTAARTIARQGFKVEVHVHDAEIVDASALRDELARCSVQVIAGQGRASSLILAVGGPLIEDVAARALGSAPSGAGASDRAPSAVAMSLFAPTAQNLARGLADAWLEEQGCRASLVTDAAQAGRAVTDVTGAVAVAVTLQVSGATSGQLRFLARPETLFVAPAPAEAVAVPSSVIDDILGGVRVELAVELGTARLSMRELGALKPGSVIALDRFIDDRLPIRCQGVVVAEGRAMVARNNMAVEIAGPHSDKGAA